MDFINVAALNESVSQTVTQMVAELLSHENVLAELNRTAADVLRAQITEQVMQRDFQPLVRAAIEKFVSENTLPTIGNIIVEHHGSAPVDSFIALAVEHEVTRIVAALAQSPEWNAQIRRLLLNDVNHVISTYIDRIDVNSAIAQEIQKYLAAKHSESLPKFGIVDNTTKPVMSLSDNGVDTQKLVCSELTCDTIEVTDLQVNGQLKFDPSALKDELTSQIACQLVEQVTSVAIAQTKEIVSSHRVQADQVFTGPVPLLADGKLSRLVTHSSLESVGELESLTVLGKTELNDTVAVLKSRVGINTAMPDSALTVWDEETALSFGKHSSNACYIGSNRGNKLVLGINRKGVVEITDTKVTVPALQINKNMVGFSNTTPVHAGTRGDWLWNTEVTDASPYAWVCLGGSRWKALK